ncbi:MAG: dihydrofolate reductase [Ruminococcaceae bacterium]|nr:dihydrofolate reductase [Oscillospiraceae bacterium]
MELIVNVSENWGIGMGDRLLVSIRADLLRFRELTMGGTVILGRKTLQTFPGGRPLKGRRNIILSTSADYQVENAEVAHNLEELLSLLRPEENTFVIGGESIYRLLLPYCERARVTKSYVNLPADRFFPKLDEMPNWKVENTEELLEENGVSFQYIDYVNSNLLPLPAAQLNA